MGAILAGAGAGAGTEAVVAAGAPGCPGLLSDEALVAFVMLPKTGAFDTDSIVGRCAGEDDRTADASLTFPKAIPESAVGMVSTDDGERHTQDRTQL